MQVDIPSRLKSKLRFYPINQVGEKIWSILKQRLTGKGNYFSEVNLPESDADKLIENIKKSGEFPSLEDESGKYEKDYEEWLVDTYLNFFDDDFDGEPTSLSEPEEDDEEDAPSGLDEFLKQVREEPTEEDQQEKEEVVSRIRTRTITPNNKKLSKKDIKKYFSGLTLGQLSNVENAVDNPSGEFVIRYNRRTNRYYAADPKELITSSGESSVGQSGEGDKKVLDALTSINDSVSKILAVLDQQNKLFKKRQETERKRAEAKRRAERENLLEKGVKKVASLAKEMLAPVQGVIDRILRFLLFTVLGKAFVGFVKWFNDPQNKERVEFLKKFLMDWWPTLMGALVLFTTPFGKFVRAFMGTVLKLTLRLSKFMIPKLLKFIAKNPKAAIAIGAGAAAVGAGMYMQSKQGERDKELQQVDPNYGKKPDPMKSFLDFGSSGGLGFNGGGIIPPTKAFVSGGMIPLAKAFVGGGEQTELTPFNGGYVDDDTGMTVTGAGADTQATILQPGEIVFSKNAVNYWGADRLLMMNKMGGGTNIPKFVNNIQMAQSGGMIGKAVHHLKKDEALSSLTRGMNDFIKPGGKSVLSGMNWGNIKPKTPVHAYKDSVGQSTIGWGSTFYDSILNGKKPVKMGDSITKERADNILTTNVSNLANTYSKKIPLWNKMSDDQKAGVLLVGYNAPYGPIGAYPNLTNALMKGDMESAAKNVQRGGPSPARLSIERKLILSGSKDLNKKVEQPPKAKVKPKQPSFIDNIKTNIMNFFAPKQKVSIEPPSVSTRQNIIDLPPIIQQSSQRTAALGETKVPTFVEPDAISAQINASIYGIG